MAYFRCTTGGSGKGNTLVVTCADDLAGATITCTNGTKTYRKTCPSTAPYEVTFYGLEAGTWTVSATVSGNTYTTTVVVVDCAALLGGFNWRTWVDTASQLDSSDYDSLDEVLADEEAVRELCLEHACVDYLADITTANEDVETIINNDLFAKWVNNSDYSLDVLGANVIIKALMDEADKYGYGEWVLMPQVPKMTSDTAPYGEVVFSGSNYVQLYPYMAFDGTDDENTRWASQGDNFGSPCYLGYHFISPVKLSAVKIKFIAGITSSTCQVQGSNTGNTNDWHDIGEAITVGALDDSLKPIKSSQAYQYYRVYISNQTQTTTRSYSGQVQTLQFYAYAPKGNVPVMTANTVPYGVASASSNAGDWQGKTRQAWGAFSQDALGYPSTSDVSNCNAWLSGLDASAPNTYLRYKNANPVSAKKFEIFYTANELSATAKIQGSNDGNVWEDITGVFTLPQTKGATRGMQFHKIEVDSTNSDYYLFIQMQFITTTNNNNMYDGENILVAISRFQFYGRELKVSVPTMTSNNAPYGEVSASSANSNYQAWKAFNGDAITVQGWVSQEVTNAWIAYAFGKKVKVKMINIVPQLAGNPQGNMQLGVKNFILQGSNDGISYDDIYTDIIPEATSVKNNYYVIEDDNAYKYLRLYVVDSYRTGGGYIIVNELQFYCEDYSEKEFEAGTTKKWLYDHGVELVDITALANGTGSSVSKENSYLFASVEATTNIIAVFYTIMDLSAYSLIRARIGDYLYSSQSSCGVVAVYSQIPNTNATGRVGETALMAGNANIPNNVNLGASSISGEKYITVGNINSSNGGIKRHASFKELWLE